MKIEQNLQYNSGLKNEQLIQQLGLKVGKEIEIKNIDTSPENKSELGKKTAGVLMKDVQIGFPIVFENGKSTKNVRNMSCEGSGKYFIQTLDSVYELKIKPNKS